MNSPSQPSPADLAALNVAIAEACGWQRTESGSGMPIDLVSHDGEQYCLYMDPEEVVRPVPDYTGDLNACAEMEATLGGQEWAAYSELLCEISGVGSPHDNPNLDYFEITVLLRLSALQRATAFARVKRIGPFKP